MGNLFHNHKKHHQEHENKKMLTSILPPLPTLYSTPPSKINKRWPWCKWGIYFLGEIIWCLQIQERWGLVVWDLWLVNVALLAKWRWRILLDASSLWFDILASIYGVFLVTSYVGVGTWAFSRCPRGREKSPSLGPKKMTLLIGLSVRLVKRVGYDLFTSIF